MKNLTTYINEKLKLSDVKQYNYHPETKEKLQDLLKQLIEERGNDGDFNDIYVSKITDMSKLFCGSNFNSFNGNISDWDVSEVRNMRAMFWGCKSFNQNLSKWDVSNVTDMFGMFRFCESFNQDISNWNVSKVRDKSYMFNFCPIEEKYIPSKFR